jgi:hypothetical protein
LKAAQTMDATLFIVATDSGMLHKLRTLNPGKIFIEAPTAGNSATCKSCAQCPWMAMNGLADVARVLETGANAIEVDAAIIPRARLPIDRMLAFTAALNNGQPMGGLIPHLGAARWVFPNGPRSPRWSILRTRTPPNWLKPQRRTGRAHATLLASLCRCCWRTSSPKYAA